MRRLPLLCALSVSLAAQAALALNDSAGTTGFGFLKIGVGARPAALGGAYAAAAGELESVAWNPAGLYGLRERTAGISLTSYLVDTEAGFLSLARPGPRRVWALSVNYVSYGELRRTDTAGADLGTFGASDVAACLTAAQRLWGEWLTGGASLKAIYSSIDEYRADAYAVDLGLLARGPLEGMSLGLSLANLGAVRRGYTRGYRDELPVLIRLGVAHRPAHTPVPVLLLADLTVPNDNDAFLAFRAEIRVVEGLYLRPGYSLQQSGAQGDEALGLSAGAGVELRRYRLDYAYSAYPDLGDVHRLSLTGRL